MQEKSLTFRDSSKFRLIRFDCNNKWNKLSGLQYQYIDLNVCVAIPSVENNSISNVRWAPIYKKLTAPSVGHLNWWRMSPDNYNNLSMCIRSEYGSGYRRAVERDNDLTRANDIVRHVCDTVIDPRVCFCLRKWVGNNLNIMAGHVNNHYNICGKDYIICNPMKLSTIILRNEWLFIANFSSVNIQRRFFVNSRN